MKQKKPLKLPFSLTAPNLIFLVSLCACGLFHEYLSALCAAALTAALVLRARKKGGLTLPLCPVNVLLIAFPFLYLLTVLWAADRGEAFSGFVKFLPVSLFTLLLADDPAQRDGLFDVLPAAGVLQTAVAAVGMQIPALRSLFSVSGRLSGFFQYSNTFALFLLLAALVLLTREKLRLPEILCLAVLAFGILYSGSRTAAVLTAVFTAAAVLTGKNKKTKWVALLCVAGIAAAAAVYALVSGDFRTIGRFLRISLTESTLVGRILYWKDGLRLFAAHPFGVGYLGWSHMQFANQTGVYTVRYIHNDFLQILLDAGAPALGAFLAALGFGFFSRGCGRRRRLMTLALCAHAFMDFDLEFVAVFLLLAALLVSPAGKPARLSLPAAAVPCAALSALALWAGLSQGLFHFRLYDAAAAVFPANTQALTALAERGGTSEGAVRRAEAAIRLNPYIPQAYGVLAAAAYEQGDVEAMVLNKEKQIENAPYHIDFYDEYCQMLAICFGLYARQNDPAGMRYCKEKMLEIPAKLEALRERTDPLAYQIDDKPSFELQPASLACIEQMKEVQIP